MVRADKKQAAVVLFLLQVAVEPEAGGGDEFVGVFGAAADIVGVEKHEFVEESDFVELVFEKFQCFPVVVHHQAAFVAQGLHKAAGENARPDHKAVVGLSFDLVEFGGEIGKIGLEQLLFFVFALAQ